MLLAGCAPLTSKKTTTTPATNTTATQALQDRIAAAESRIAGLEAQGNSTKTDVDSINDRLTVVEGNTTEVPDYSSEIADLQEQIDALTDEIDELNSPSDSNGSTLVTSEPIRWRLVDPIVYSYATDNEIAGNLFTDIVADDSRLEEEGVYYLDLIVRNDDSANITLGTFYIKFVMRPYTSEYALLDESATYLDTDDVWVSTGLPSLAEPSWDASYDTREREGKDITKKVVFESERCAASTFTLTPGDTIRMTLFLELYYAD